MVLERSIFSDFVFMEAMYKQGYIRKQCESLACMTVPFSPSPAEPLAPLICCLNLLLWSQ